MSGKVFRAIGLMSGTSCDGVDAAYIETNGHGFVVAGDAITEPYRPNFRRQLQGVLGRPDDPALPEVTRKLTELHAEAVRLLLLQIGKTAADIDVIGFHGQTIFHAPHLRQTIQLGDGALLAQLTGIAVVNDFRSADVAAGGQGAPLVPLYHAAIAAKQPKPCAIVNIGGVANVTYLGADGEIIAADTGPGCALIDDAMQAFFGLPCDADGGIAAMGSVDEKLVAAWLADDFFAQPPPKSLDRDHFKKRADVSGLAPDDAVATLTAFTARSIAAIAAHLPTPPLAWFVTGGGRHNPVLMAALSAATGADVRDIHTMGFDGDALEAQAFAYLAVRHMLQLPLSLPTTTGVPMPMTGGQMHGC